MTKTTVEQDIENIRSSLTTHTHELRSVRSDVSDLRDQMRHRRIMSGAIVVGALASVAFYSATISDNWTSQVESLVYSAGAGVAAAVVTAIYLAVTRN